MTGEEMERAIEFLLQGQANHQMRLDELTGNLNQLTQQVADMNRIFQLNADTQTSFIQVVTRHIEAQGEINASLRAAINRMDTRITHTDARITHTDVRLDRLEALVERYIEGRGDQP
ncbi:MAG TPA: hypothetical protein VJ842_05885 [Pyrinomonadaceae bacterium]|nr:hypothetical protein [Pyrinomonadaceae bacterium]